MNKDTERSILLYLSKAQLIKAVALTRLLSPSPIVAVNPDGIAVNPLSLWFVNLKISILWAEISAIYIQELTIRSKGHEKTHRLLCILPKNIDAFAERHKLLSWRRYVLWGIMAMSEAPVTIFEEMIQPHSLDALFAQMRDLFQDEIRINGIGVREEQQRTFK